MFIINGSKTEFTQWEQGITLKNTNMAKGDAVQFYSASGESAIMYAKEENGTVVVEVPNRMLQFAANITARLVKGGGVTSFAVMAAEKATGYTFKDNEYRETLPEHLQFGNEIVVGGDTLTWDGNTDGLEDFEGVFYHVSDAYPTLAEAQNGGLGTFSIGATGSLTAMDMTEALGFECYQLYLNGETPVALCSSQNFEKDGVQLYKGAYLLTEGGMYVSSLTINGYNGFTTKTIKPLDEKYMPVLTSPSGKKFKITVADNGTLGTTEV